MAYEDSRSWRVDDPAGARSVIEDFASRHGFALEAEGDGLALERGSQTRMRSAGATRAEEEDLPLEGTASFGAGSVDVRFASHHVGLVLGVGPMPAGVRERYAALVDGLLADLDGRLGAATG